MQNLDVDKFGLMVAGSHTPREVGGVWRLPVGGGQAGQYEIPHLQPGTYLEDGSSWIRILISIYIGMDPGPYRWYRPINS